jgi:MoxR-like ATPase
MSLKREASDLINFLKGEMDKLETGKTSVWVPTDEAANSAGVTEADLRKVLRRPRIKKMLEDVRIGCSFKGAHLYLYQKSGYDTGTVPADIGDDDTAPPTPPAPVQNWELDTDYYYMPPVAKDIEIAIDAGKNIFSVGPAGCGKSSMFERIFKARGVTPMVVSFHGEVSVFDLVGGKDLVNGATVWTDGILPICMRKGIPMIIDEADATPPDVQFVLHPVLMGQPLCLTRNGAEFVNAEPGFMIVATGNTVGRGDDSQLYVGTNVLNEAYLDRYGMVFDHWYMPEDEEIRVLVKRTGVHKKTAEKMVKVASSAREAMLADKLSSTFSTRKLLDWCDLHVRGMKIGKAFMYSCIGKVSPEDKEAVAKWGHAVFGSALDLDPKQYAR